MTQFKQWFEQDFTEKIEIRHCESVMFTGDDKGAVVGVRLYDNGAAYSGGGTVSGAVKRYDGGLVALTGTLSGNAASVVITAAALAYPGPIGVHIVLTQGGSVTTVLKAIYSVEDNSGAAVDPGTIIPSINDLITAINTAVASIPSDYSALLHTLAPDFNASTAYAAGDYVWYNGTLYRFTADHTAGSWTGTDAVLAVIGDDIAALSDSLNGVSYSLDKISTDSYNLQNISYDFRDDNRSLAKTGKNVTTGSVILSYPVTAGSIIYVSFSKGPGGNVLFFFQNAQTVPWNSNTNIVGDIHTGNRYSGFILVPAGATYLVTNADMEDMQSRVYNVTSFAAMKYRGALGAGPYTNAAPGTYSVSNASVTGLPSGMSQPYGWLTCYAPNNLYMLVESNTSKRTWMKEGSSDWVIIYPEVTQSRLKNKLISYNGDSIAESRFSGFSSNGGGYPYLISQAVGGTYENKAVSGGTLAVSSAGHHVCETISTMSDSADIVCLEGGINDYWLNVSLGDFSESDFTGTVDDTTICGALESIFRQAINKWPGKPIVFLIVHKITTTAWTPNSAGYTFAQARQKMIGICEKYSIPYVDMWGSGGLNAYMSVLNNTYLNGGSNTHPDGCHPDENGYKKYYVPRLISAFEALLPYN